MLFLGKKCILATIGLFFVLFGVVFSLLWGGIFEQMLAKELVLAPNAKSYELWKTPPVPLVFDVYLYNWTNPSNFSSQDFVKPILREIGPYRFREVTDKTHVRWNPKNSTISYRRKSTYFFDAEGSVGKLDDMITTVNVVALSAAAKSRQWGYVRQKEVSLGLNLYSQKVHVTKEARELLFEGYQDDLIDMAQELSKFGDERFSVPYDRFGWFYKRNESDHLSGHFNIHTGVGDMSQFGQVKNWNYQSKTDYFGDECSEVLGSGGEFYTPHQTKDKPLQLFNGEVCRYLNLYYTGEEIIHGVKAYKYGGTERTVDNGTKYPENECFSVGDKVPSGVMNITACRFGAPVLVSFPHFYAADPYYLSQIDGLSPSKEKHEFFITLEPRTGIPVNVAARLQANVMVRPVPNVAMYENAPVLYFPVIWFEQKVQVPAEMIEDIKTVVIIPTIGYCCAAIIIAVGAIISTYFIFNKCMLQKSNERELEKGNKEKNLIAVSIFNGKSLEDSPLVFKNDPDLKSISPVASHQIKSNGKEMPTAPLAKTELDEYENAEGDVIAERESIMTPQ